ncbi:unnamed protein product [Trifolium pratense]|uniref:Uncharacterized protein n=1 Tax=Trifolium pratense TaxID=57577 RepID=A0ACB0MAF0_TRIPR|nr:unnamed protein product [Trifolium pratense]
MYGSPFSLIGSWGYYLFAGIVACRWRELFLDFLHIALFTSRDKCLKLRNQIILLLMFFKSVMVCSMLWFVALFEILL